MDYQSFYFVCAFGCSSAVVYLLSLLINRDDDNLSLLRHSMGIFTLMAAASSIFVFVEFLLINTSLNELAGYQNILFIIIMAFYVWESIVYLVSLISDWHGLSFSAIKNVIGILTVIVTVLSIYLL